MVPTARRAAVVLLLLVGASAVRAGPLDDTHRNDGLSMQEADLHRSAVYESIKRVSGLGQQQQQQPPVYLSLTQTITAPSSSDQLVLPVCLGPGEVSRALEGGINTAFKGQLSQNASVDTTYVQRLNQCTYQSFVTYWGSAGISKTLVAAGKAGRLCDSIPQYCTALNVLTAEAAASAQPAATASQQQQPRKTGAKSVGGKAAAVAQADDGSGSGSSAAGSPEQQGAASLSPGSRRRASSSISSGARYILAQTAASVTPDLPPVLHYNCQKHVFLQLLDHFASTTPKSPTQPGDKEPVPGEQDGPGAAYSHGPDSYNGPDGEEGGLGPEEGPGPHPGYSDEGVPGEYGLGGGHGGPGKPGSRPHHHHGHKQQQQQQHDAHMHAKQIQKQQKQHAKPGSRKHVKGAHRVHADAAAGDDEAEVLGLSEEYYSADDEVQGEVQGEEEILQVALQGARLGSSWKPPGVAGAAQRGSARGSPTPVSADAPFPEMSADMVLRSPRDASEGARLKPINPWVSGPAWEEQQQLQQAVEAASPIPDTQQTVSSDAPQDSSDSSSTPPAEELPVFDLPADMSSPATEVPVVDFPADPSIPATELPAAGEKDDSFLPDAPPVAAADDKLLGLVPRHQQQQQPGAVKQPTDSSGPVLPGSQQEQAPGSGDEHKQDGAGQAVDGLHFKQVYWVCDAAWPTDAQEQRTSGNVVVFLGNEGPLGTPQQPIVFENARRLNALVVLIEHRYYGESLPFEEPAAGPLPTDKYKWLTMAQVIEDSVAVVAHVRKQRAVPKATPNIVVGGSYGGMLAAYHRLKRPDYFAAAVASSAPMQYIVDTPMWAESSNAFHAIIARAADVMSGSTACSKTIRAGLDMMLDAAISPAGRQQLAQTFKLCDVTRLDSKEAVQALLRDLLYTFQGIAQVNNQPPVLEQMALACSVVTSTTEAGGSALEALAAVLSLFYSDGGSEWCYSWGFDPRTQLVPGAGSWGYNSYSYQCCTQGTVFSSLLPAQGSADSLNPEDLSVSVKQVQAECRTVFGKDVKPLHAPGFARNFMRLLRREGGVVFTNGDLDGWAGGSLGLAGSSNGKQQQAPQDDSLPAHGGREAGVHVSSMQAVADSSADAATSISSRTGSGAGSLPGKPMQAATKAGPPRSNGLSKGVSGRVTATQPTQVPHRQEEGEEQPPGVGQGGPWGGGGGGPGVPQHPPPYKYHQPEDDSDRRGSRREGGGPQAEEGQPVLDRVAFITYKNASHCTDTHTYAWQTPGEPPEWKAQRAEAMERAAAFAMPARLRHLRADPLLPLIPETEQAV